MSHDLAGLIEPQFDSPSCFLNIGEPNFDDPQNAAVLTGIDLTGDSFVNVNVQLPTSIVSGPKAEVIPASDSDSDSEDRRLESDSDSGEEEIAGLKFFNLRTAYLDLEDDWQSPSYAATSVVAYEARRKALENVRRIVQFGCCDSSATREVWENSK